MSCRYASGVRGSPLRADPAQGTGGALSDIFELESNWNLEVISGEVDGRKSEMPSIGKSHTDGAVISNSPEEFLKLAGPGKHLILFYENSDHARRIEFAFIDAGLRTGESALYASSKDDSRKIMDGMKAFGINVDHYVKSGLLRVLEVPDPALNPEGALHGFKEFLTVERGSVTGPLRQVTRLFDPSTEAEANSIMEIERLVSTSLRGTPDSVLCSFRMKGELHPSFGAWFMEMIKDHHGALFVPASSEGVAFSVK